MSKLSMSRRSFVKTAAVTSAAVALSGSATTVALAEDAQAGAGAGEIKRIRTGCRGCGKMECGVIAVVQDGKVIRIEGDPEAFQSMGNCCTKSQSSLQAAYHPDRLRYPLKRTNPKDNDDPGWQRISWDEAISTVVSKLDELQAKYGGESLFGMAGTSRVVAVGPEAGRTEREACSSVRSVRASRDSSPYPLADLQGPAPLRHADGV